MEDLYQLAEQASKSLFQQGGIPSNSTFPFQAEDAVSIEKLFSSKYDSGLDMETSRRRLQETIIPPSNSGLNFATSFKQEEEGEMSPLPYLEDSPDVFSTEEIEFLCEYESNKENFKVVPVALEPSQAKNDVPPTRKTTSTQPSAGVDNQPNKPTLSTAHSNTMNGKGKKALRITKRTLKVTKRTLKVSKSKGASSKQRSVARKVKKENNNVKPPPKAAAAPKRRAHLKPFASATASAFTSCPPKPAQAVPAPPSKKKQMKVKKDKDGCAHHPSGNGSERSSARARTSGGGGGDQGRVVLEAKILVRKRITQQGHLPPAQAQAKRGKLLQAPTETNKSTKAKGKPQAEAKAEESERRVNEEKTKRRAQNRISSARFRAKNRSAREIADKLQDAHLKLKHDLKRSEENSTRVSTENCFLRYKLDEVLAEMLAIRKKFWLRQKVSFKTVALCVLAFLRKMPLKPLDRGSSFPPSSAA